MLPPGSDPPPALPAPSGWLERLRRGMRRQIRKLYRIIRHPRERRKGALRNWLGARIHNRDLWHFRRHPVANGVAGGLFLSMLPLPAQSLCAAAVGIARGWNLPAAIAATWVSNPATYAPMFIAAKSSVTGLYHLFGAEPAIRNLSPSQLRELDWEGWWDFARHAGPELLLGYVIVGLICALAGYLLVHSCWWLVRHHESPRRAVRASVAARRLRKQQNGST